MEKAKQHMNSFTSTTTNSIARTMVSLLFAALFVLSLSGCAEGYDYYADAYHTPEYRYNIDYGLDYYPYYPWHSYYGGSYYYEY
jgi:hypothetical protein